MGAVFHIGAPKTGTTCLQKWLSANAAVLADHGIAPLSSRSSHRLGVEGLADQARLERPDILDIKKLPLREAVAELAGASAGSAAAVVSSEYLSESSPQKVAELVAAAGVPVSLIVCYLRRQDVICASGFAEAVKTLGESNPVRGAGYTPMLDWDVLHDSWRAAFPGARVVFRNFDRVRKQSNLEHDFAHIIGAGSIPTKSVGDGINPSYSAEMTEVARRMNEAGATFSRAVLMELQADGVCPPFAFSQKITSQFEDAYLASNRRLAAAFPGEFDDFAMPGWVPRGEDCTENLADERLFRIFAQCLNYVDAKSEEWMNLRRSAEAKNDEYAFMGRACAALQSEYDLKVKQIDALLRMRAEELGSPRFLARHLWQAACARLRARLLGR
jgi:hypothetical protein